MKSMLRLNNLIHWTTQQNTYDVYYLHVSISIYTCESIDAFIDYAILLPVPPSSVTYPSDTTRNALGCEEK